MTAHSPKAVLDIFYQHAMMGLAPQDEKNAARYSQAGFFWQLIFTAPRRHNTFWRLSGSPSHTDSRTSKATAREPEADFNTGASTGKLATRSSEPELTAPSQTREGATRGPAVDFAARGRCGCDQEYTSET